MKKEMYNLYYHNVTGVVNFISFIQADFEEVFKENVVPYSNEINSAVEFSMQR